MLPKENAVDRKEWAKETQVTLGTEEEEDARKGRGRRSYGPSRWEALAGATPSRQNFWRLRGQAALAAPRVQMWTGLLQERKAP